MLMFRFVQNICVLHEDEIQNRFHSCVTLALNLDQRNEVSCPAFFFLTR